MTKILGKRFFAKDDRIEGLYSYDLKMKDQL